MKRMIPHATFPDPAAPGDRLAFLVEGVDKVQSIRTGPTVDSKPLAAQATSEVVRPAGADSSSGRPAATSPTPDAPECPTVELHGPRLAGPPPGLGRLLLPASPTTTSLTPTSARPPARSSTRGSTTPSTWITDDHAPQGAGQEHRLPDGRLYPRKTARASASPSTGAKVDEYRAGPGRREPRLRRGRGQGHAAHDQGRRRQDAGGPDDRPRPTADATPPCRRC